MCVSGKLTKFLAIYTSRWTRGLIPRGVREVIFGVGINQLSDACEERIGDVSLIDTDFGLLANVAFRVGLNVFFVCTNFVFQPFQDIENTFMRTMAGSMIAGVAAGYFSHVPHNVSTIKLLNPNLTYPQVGFVFVVSDLITFYCIYLFIRWAAIDG